MAPGPCLHRVGPLLPQPLCRHDPRGTECGNGAGGRRAQRPGRGGVRAAASSCLSPRLLLPLRTQGGSPRLGTGWAPAARWPLRPDSGPRHCGPPRCGAGAGGRWPRVPWHAQALRALALPAPHQTSAQAAPSSLPRPLPSTGSGGREPAPEAPPLAAGSSPSTAPKGTPC